MTLPSQTAKGVGKGSYNEVNGYGYHDGPEPGKLSQAADKYFPRYYKQEKNLYLATLLAILAACQTGDVECGFQFIDAVNTEYLLIHASIDPECDSSCFAVAKGAAVIGVGAVSDGGPVGTSKATATGARRGGRGCHSFAPDTDVLMADGTTKEIKDVKIGDKVQATDPETGETAAKTVLMIHLNYDSDLTDITITTTDGHTTTLHTTQHHPFWSETHHTWTDAADLQPGEKLRTTTSQTATITAVHNRAGAKFMHDLTIHHIHTYYVLAGNTPVLVHNTGPCGADIAGDLGGLPTGRQPHVRTVGTESELQGLYNRWSRGGTDITPSGYNGTMTRLPDGTIVGLRNASRSGGATIDIKLPDGTTQKVHIDGP